jgi:SAM-dependent methyltransferase
MKRYKAIAEYYDAEYAGLEILQQDVPFLLGQMPRRRQKILELATGTARAAVPLAQAGHRVVGIDNDPTMLKLAKIKRDSVGIAPRDLALLRGNALNVRSGERFDWVICLFNTFLNFTSLKEQDRFLETVRAHMKPGGRYFMDVFNPDLSLVARAETKDLNPVTFFVPALNRTVSRTADVRRDGVHQVQRITMRYRWFDPFGKEHRAQNHFNLTWMLPRELEILLDRHGLQIEHLWGNYDGSPVTESSPRLIARCRLR